jgi:hypothetical protein
MNPRIKINSALLEKMLRDLERPHPFAWERVGFLSCSQVLDSTGPILLCHDYHPVPNDDYLVDKKCGARIGEAAIQMAMQRVLDNGFAQLWVHTHGRTSRTTPSRLDREEAPNVVRSLTNVDSSLCHGWAVLSEREATGQIHLPNRGLVEVDELTVLGWPMIIPRRRPAGRSGSVESIHARRGFLGADAPEVIEHARLGIIGLGGGGSHVNQQLTHIGFRNFVYADSDKIEMSNLNRLVGGTLDDVREQRYKTKIAERIVLSIHPDAAVNSAPKRWEEKTRELSMCDIIIGCIDGFAGRRDLEQFCRSQMIPLIDIGMVVKAEKAKYPQIYGQAVVSMPDTHCLRCLGVITDENLAFEAGDYGAGPQPQVVWPNGMLASAAVGYVMHLLTGWSRSGIPPQRLDLKGAEQTLTVSKLVGSLSQVECCHFGLEDLGDPKLRRV